MKRIFMSLALCAILMAGILTSPVKKANAALKEVIIDEEEYNLYVEDTPSFTGGTVAAKMNNTSKTSLYTLSLFDDADSTDVMIEALAASKVKVSEDKIYGMDVMLYKQDADEEYYPTEGSINVTIICPIPDDWAENPDKVQLYRVNSKKAVTQAFTLVSVDEIPCAQFTIKSNGVYGFINLSSDEEDIEEDYEEEYIDDSEEVWEEEEEIPTKAPTKAPTPVPTKAPAASNVKNEVKPVTPTKVPEPVSEKVSSNTSNQTASGSNSSKPVQNARPLDKTPITGDAAPLGLWAVTACLSGSAIAGCVIYLKKK